MKSRSLKCSLIGMLAFAAGAGVYGQADAACSPPPLATFQSISRAEIESMLADIAVSNPKVLDRFRDEPELKRDQIDNLRELFAFASAAIKEGHASDSPYCVELENIRDESTAVEYDKIRNKARGKFPPFAFISKTSVSSFWSGTLAKPLSTKVRDGREAGFKRFLDAKLQLLAWETPGTGVRVPSEAEIEQARELYAKIQIYAEEYQARRTALPLAGRNKVALQVKLQQAQFLAKRYAEVVVAAVAADDDEIRRFIAADPTLSTTSKRSKAEEIFERAKKGEDFAALANEFSEDPGNKGEDGKPRGGLYSGVRKGVMVPEFERAALAAKEGQVYPELVETDFGFHIVKLEKKGADDTYDVRHILISTMVKDPANPDGRELPIRMYAKSSLEEAKQKKLIESIVAENRITVPNDFTVPSTAPAKRVVKPAAKPAARRTVRKRN